MRVGFMPDNRKDGQYISARMGLFHFETPDGVRVMARQIDGDFPDYTRVLPTGNDNCVTVDRIEFKQALSLVSTVTAEMTRCVRFDLASDLQISSDNPSTDEARETIAVRDRNGSKLCAGFNAKYWLEMIGATDSKAVTMYFNDDLSPSLTVPVDDQDSRAVIMPIRL